MSKNPEPQDRFTEILQHRIKFWLRGDDAPTELDECSVEHITKAIKDGYREGELCVMGETPEVGAASEYRGWWSLWFLD